MVGKPARKIPSGVSKLDSLLSGGLPVGFITHVFGPKGGGKTTFSIQCALNASFHGSKVFYIDAEHSLHPKRLQQLLIYKGDLRRIMVVKPFSFTEQERIIEQLSASLPLHSLIIIDSIASMYRLELEEKEKNIIANRRLNMQLAELLAIAQRSFSAVLLTNQVTIDPETGDMRPVGWNVISYWSAIDLKMERIAPGKVKVTLVKGETGKVGSCVELSLSGRGLI